MFILYILLLLVLLVILVPVLLVVFVLLFKRDVVMDMARSMQAKVQDNTGHFNSSRKQKGAPMSKAEALQVLGLEPDAKSADVNKAYHNLMKSVHPDKGGSDFLAQQINQARDTLLKNSKT